MPLFCRSERKGISCVDSTESFQKKMYTCPIIAKGEKCMMKHILKTLYVSLLLMVLSMAASAAENGGSLWVKLNVGDLPVINGALTLYRVGTPISDGYRIGEEFGGGFVREADADSQHLAQWLISMEGKQGDTVLMDADGNAVFSDLEDGLYLLAQTERMDGFYPVHPLLLTIPNGGKRDVSLWLEPLPMVADAPPTGQDPTPYLGIIGLIISLAGLTFCTGGKRHWW